MQYLLPPISGPILENVPFLLQYFYQVGFIAADVHISHGCMGLTSVECRNCWSRLLEYYIPTNSNPYPKQRLFEKIIHIVTGFAEMVRAGYWGQNNQVIVQYINVSLHAIGQTCESDRGKNPLQRAPERYLKPIEHHLLCMINEEPVPVLELSLLVALPKQIIPSTDGTEVITK